LRDIWERIEASFQSQAPGELWRLTSGATEDQIVDLESQIGQRLPDDIRQSYAVHNGVNGYVVPAGQILSEFNFLLNLKSIASAMIRGRVMLNGGESRIPNPIGPVKRVWWSLGWVPIVGEGTGDYLCIDLDPPPDGSVGQVFDFGHEYGPTGVLFPDFRSYLERYCADLESGAIRFDDESEEWVRAGNPEV
jgi:cell wall assembly regulator SMI1